jgi:hypothetical protein
MQPACSLRSSHSQREHVHPDCATAISVTRLPFRRSPRFGRVRQCSIAQLIEGQPPQLAIFWCIDWVAIELPSEGIDGNEVEQYRPAHVLSRSGASVHSKPA